MLFSGKKQLRYQYKAQSVIPLVHILFYEATISKMLGEFSITVNTITVYVNSILDPF